MRKYISIICFYLLCISQVAFAQSVYTVSSNSRIPAQFTDLSEAIEQAEVGSTIYVHPSDKAYGDVEIKKSITIIGGGFMQRPEFYNTSTELGTITIIPNGSNVKVANCKLSGITLADPTKSDANPEGSGNHNYGELLLEHNYIGIIGVNIYDPTLFELTANIRNNTIERIAFISENELTVLDRDIKFNIDNNVIGYVTNLKGLGIVFTNNVFYSGGVSISNALIEVNSVAFFNNIFLGRNGSNAIGISSTANCMFANNASSNIDDNFEGGIDNSFADNLSNISPEFETMKNETGLYNWVQNVNFTLENTSVLKEAGSQGTDIGILGGNYPYQPTHYYNMPMINSVKIEKPLISEDNKTIKVIINAKYPEQN